MMKKFLLFLQKYLIKLRSLSIERTSEKAKELDIIYPVTFDAKLFLDGTIYPSEDEELFFAALKEKLPSSRHIIIDCVCNGVLREFFNDEFVDEFDEAFEDVADDAESDDIF